MLKEFFYRDSYSGYEPYMISRHKRGFDRGCKDGFCDPFYGRGYGHGCIYERPFLKHGCGCNGCNNLEQLAAIMMLLNYF